MTAMSTANMGFLPELSMGWFDPRVRLGCVEILQFSMGWVGSNVTKVNIYIFWWLHNIQLHQLSCSAVVEKIHTDNLHISASSAQSERDFSSVGHTIADVRSRLWTYSTGYACWHAQPVTSVYIVHSEHMLDHLLQQELVFTLWL